MGLLAKKNHTVGNRTRWVVDYTEWLKPGAYILTMTVTSSSADAPVSGVALLHDDKHIVFFTNGGVLDEVFTVSLSVTDTLTEIKNDTIEFTVVAP